MWSIGVADIATLNQPFVALVASVLPFEANPSQFFAVFDSLGVITTHLGAPNSRSGRFRVNDDDNDNDNDNRRTKRLLYPLLRMRARGKYCALPIHTATIQFHSGLPHIALHLFSTSLYNYYNTCTYIRYSRTTLLYK